MQVAVLQPYEDLTNIGMALPEFLRPSCEQLISSVRLSQFFAVRDEAEWVDRAEVALTSQGRVRVKLTGVRSMTFSAIDDEFSGEG